MAACRCVEFTSPGSVRVVEEPRPRPGRGEVLVATQVSAISAGTELLVYRGDAPMGEPLDEALESLAGSFGWPVRYGYAAVGVVVDAAGSVPPELVGRPVFAFQPHRSHFVTPPDRLVPLPPGLDPAAGSLLPTMETALGLVMDARPVAGERVVVFGQGVVGLLVTAVLATMPLAALVAVDPIPARREAALELGAAAALDPGDEGALRDALGPDGADVAIEVSGRPAGLDGAIRATGREGRVIVGSWYGDRPVAVDLGTRFHRGRIRILSSQVSRLAPELGARWSKPRRLSFALELLRRIPVERLITHRIPIEEAPSAYRLLDEAPETALQVLLTYGTGDDGACTASA